MTGFVVFLKEYIYIYIGVDRINIYLYIYIYIRNLCNIIIAKCFYHFISITHPPMLCLDVSIDLSINHIYIYIYILLSTNRLFRCLKTLQCG